MQATKWTRAPQARLSRSSRPKCTAFRSTSLRLRNQLVRLGQRLDRLVRVLERRLRHDDRQRLVLGALQLGRDARRRQEALDLLRLVDVAGDRKLHHASHEGSDDTASGAVCTAPPLTSAGTPRSGNGISITSKSRGTTVSAKNSRASRSTSGPK